MIMNLLTQHNSEEIIRMSTKTEHGALMVPQPIENGATLAV